MTNKEAIEILKKQWTEDYDATELAIEALEKTSDEGCSRCTYKNKCAIVDNFNIDYCSDWSDEE